MRGQQDVNESPTRDAVAAVPSPATTARNGLLAGAMRLLVTLRSWPSLPWAMAPALVLGPALAQENQETGGVKLEVAGDQITLSVNETTGVPIKDFIKLAQKITGKVFTFNDAEFQTQGTNVNFIGPVRIKRDGFYSFFQTMLYIRGFACVPRSMSGEQEVVEIISLASPRRNEITSAARYVPVEDLEQYSTQTGVQVLTTVPLRYVNANNASQQTRPFFTLAGSPGVGGLTLGTIESRTMLVQGFGPQVWAAYQLLKLADVPPVAPDEETRVVKLSNATAEELEPVLKQVLEDRARRIQAAQAAGGQPVQAGTPDAVQVLALASLNALLVSGSPDRITEALDLIAQLDVPVELAGGDIHVTQLRNVLAEDLANTLRNFLREDQVAEQQAQAGQQTATRRPRPTVIVSHPESNTILISAAQSKFKQIERMIQELDVRQPQVLIEAALVELSTNDLDQLGVELGALDIADGKFTRPFGFTHYGISNFQDTNGDDLPDTRLPDFENPLQGFTGGIISSDDFAIPILINAIAQDTHSNILSLPSIVVNNNENALVKSEENRPTTQTTQGTSTTQTGVGQPRVAGIELNISPSISTNDYLRLNIDINVSRFVGQADPTTGGITISRQVKTQVTLPSGSTVVLGGIIEDQQTTSKSGIPYLKDIPLLGILFSTSRDENTKTNLYFFVTPTILDEPDFSDLREVSQRKKLEASDYIGDRRLRIVDSKWLGGQRATLDDRDATIEELDRYGGFELPHRVRPATAPKTIDGKTPTGPLLPSGTDTGNAERKPDGGDGR